MKIFKKYINSSQSTSKESAGIIILNLGHNIHPPNRKYPEKEHPDEYYFDYEKGRSLKEYQIIYIAKGEGVFETNGEPPKKIYAGTILLIFPGLWHRFKPTKKTGWEEYWVGFKGQYAHYLLEQKCFNPKQPIIRLGFNQEFLTIFSKLINTVEFENNLIKSSASFHLINLLGITYTSVLSSNSSQSHKEQIIRKMQDKIHEQWDKNIDFKELSLSFEVSYSWFRKAFKEVLNTSPNQYVLMLKLRNATKIIQESNLPLSEIAYECGFNSEFYFSKIFKQKMGVNPSNLRMGKMKILNNQ
jgi:AraC-like DNA-binding protein